MFISVYIGEEFYSLKLNFLDYFQNFTDLIYRDEGPLYSQSILDVFSRAKFQHNLRWSTIHTVVNPVKSFLGAISNILWYQIEPYSIPTYQHSQL